GRAQPARLQDVRGPRGGAARADPRAGAALAQSRAAQGGGGGAREPRGDSFPPEAPASHPRSPPHHSLAVDLRDYIRDIPDFPKPGIVFRDITPLLLDPAALSAAVDELSHYAREREVELVAAAEARGFILGGAVAEK